VWSLDISSKLSDDLVLKPTQSATSHSSSKLHPVLPLHMCLQCHMEVSWAPKGCHNFPLLSEVSNTYWLHWGLGRFMTMSLRGYCVGCCGSNGSQVGVSSSSGAGWESLPQAEQLNYIRILIMCDGRMEQEMDRWILIRSNEVSCSSPLWYRGSWAVVYSSIAPEIQNSLQGL